MKQPVVLVLASGRGERFIASGGEGSKLQARLAGKPVLSWTLDAVKESELPWHLEDVGHEGMGDAIAAAVRATADAEGWLVLPGDLPLVHPDTIRAVASALEPDRVVVPQFRGQRGHPVAFGREFGAALAALQGPAGAARIVQVAADAGALALVESDDVGVVTDIDTVDDLRRAEDLLATRA